MNTLFEPSTAAALTTRIDHLRPESARQWGRMSVGGMVCHLSDAFRMAVGDRETRDRGNLVTKTIIRFVAFWTPLRWPHGVKTLPEADQELDGTPPGTFAEDAAELKDLMERFAAQRSSPFPRHPLFGRMTNAEWGRWGYRHVDHHLRQFGR